MFRDIGLDEAFLEGQCRKYLGSQRKIGHRKGAHSTYVYGNCLQHASLGKRQGLMAQSMIGQGEVGQCVLCTWHDFYVGLVMFTPL